MTKDPASGTGTAKPNARAYTPFPIYGPECSDDTATGPSSRARQLYSMCRVLLAASDTNLTIEPEFGGHIEVMTQLADELRQSVDDLHPNLWTATP